MGLLPVFVPDARVTLSDVGHVNPVSMKFVPHTACCNVFHTIAVLTYARQLYARYVQVTIISAEALKKKQLDTIQAGIVSMVGAGKTVRAISYCIISYRVIVQHASCVVCEYCVHSATDMVPYSTVSLHCVMEILRVVGSLRRQ